MPSENRMSLFVPEWQGYAVDCTPMTGAKCLRDWIFGDVNFVEVNIDDRALPPTENFIQGYAAIERTLVDMRNCLAKHEPDFVFTLGGT